MSYYRDRSPPGRGAYKREEVTRRVSIMVKNLPKSIAPNDLRYYAEKYGPVKDVYLPKDFYSGEPRGLGFVEYYEERDAEEAIRSLDRMELGGRVIQANYAMQGRKRPDDFRRGGGYGGGGRDRYSDKGRDHDRGRDYDRDRGRDYDRRDRDRGRDRDYYDDRRRSSRSRSRSPERRSRSPAARSPPRARTRSPTPDRRADSRSPARNGDKGGDVLDDRRDDRSPDRGNSQD